MSFLRPEVVAGWRRWRGALVPAAGLALLLWWTLPDVLSGAPLAIGIAALGTAILGPLALIEWRRARLSQPADAPGIVTVTERRIGFWGPRGGGFVALADIVRIELLTDPALGAIWRLSTPGGALDIPASAQGADALYDAFAPLPGIDWDAVAGAIDGPFTAMNTVWEKDR
jgi:hypothetical protein